jgi:hypothetical protein
MLNLTVIALGRMSIGLHLHGRWIDKDTEVPLVMRAACVHAHATYMEHI